MGGQGAAYGLYDMTGNVWEWTQDSFTASHSQEPCCAPPSDERIPRRIIKGGSHRCAPNYCLRFRPAARQGEAVDTSTSHIGFRCILRPYGGTAGRLWKLGRHSRRGGVR
jgi:sulfatase modifying factor 1